MWWLFTGLDGIWGRLNGGGDEAGKPFGLDWPKEIGRGRTGDELSFAPL
jgi:hypothetical protein